MPQSDNPKSHVIVTGVGLVCPLGHSAWSTFAALLEGKSLVDRAAALPDHIDPISLVRSLGAVSVAQHVSSDPVIDLAEHAAREATTMAGAALEDLPCHMASSKGAIHALEAACCNIGNSPARSARTGLSPHVIQDAPLAVALGAHGYLTHHLRKRLKVALFAPHVAACATGLVSLHQARMRLLRRDATGGGQPVLVVAAEASLMPLLIHSYRRLGVLPRLNTTGYRGLPLDRRRAGFMLADMGAAVVLESVSKVQPGQIELVDTAVANEAHDVVRSAPGMSALNHIAQQLLSFHPVDLLHPHATGTIEHDPAELAVYARHLRRYSGTDVYACKGALGHGLGASGLTALVIAWLCAKTKRRPPMPWLDHPIDAPQGLYLAGSSPRTNPRRHAVFAAGFGGSVAGAVIQIHPTG